MVVINFWAVLIAAIASMVLGMVWYSPSIFGKVWARAAEKNIEDMTEGTTTSYLAAFVSAMVTSYILAYFIYYVDANTSLSGLKTAFWIWLGFVATTSLSQILWEGRSIKLYLLNNGYHLISLLLMGMIIALWR